MKLSEAIEKYFEYLSLVEGLDPKTIKIRRIYLVPFSRAIKEITIENCLEYVRNLDKSDTTKFRTKIAIKDFLKYLNNYYDTHYKYELIKLKSPPDNIRNNVTVEDFEKIDKYLHSVIETRREVLRIHTIVHLMWDTGLRRCEILNLEVENIDFEKKVFKVLSPKSDRWRVGFFEHDLTKYLEKYKPKKFLFELNECRVSSFISQLLKKVIPEKKLTAHSFRHGAVTRWIENGMPLELAQNLAGHVKLETTMRYFHTYGSKMRDAYNLYNQPPKIFEFKSKVGIFTKGTLEIKYVKNKRQD